MTSEEPNSFSSRFLCWILQLGFVKYLVGDVPAARGV